MENQSRFAALALVVLLTLTLGASAQTRVYDDPAHFRGWIEAARQFERATENFVHVLGRRVRGFEGVERQARRLHQAARQLSTGNRRGYGGQPGFAAHEVELAYYATRDSIHSGIRFPPNQRSERSYYTLINGWAQVVYAFDRLSEHTPDRGRGGDRFPGNPAYGSRQVVRCQSRDYRLAECRVPGYILDVDLLNQHSRASCLEGRSFGFRGDRLWVDEGCDADFRVTLR